MSGESKFSILLPRTNMHAAGSPASPNVHTHVFHGEDTHKLYCLDEWRAYENERKGGG